MNFFLKIFFASLSWKKKERKRLFAHNKTRFEIENLINLKLWWKNTLWTLKKKYWNLLEFFLSLSPSTPPPKTFLISFSLDVDLWFDFLFFMSYFFNLCWQKDQNFKKKNLLKWKKQKPFWDRHNKKHNNFKIEKKRANNN